MFSSVDLHNNIRWHIAQVAVFITEASKRPRQKRGGFYKASYLFIASAVEAVVHDIVKKYCESNNVTRRQEFDYKHVVSLPNNLFLDSNANIGIYQKVAKPFIWDDKIEFNALNEIGRKYLLFDNRIFKKLDKVRNMRNKIHIQNLGSHDNKYTLRDIENVSNILINVLDIYDSHR
jgi:hypothetical protein